MMHQNSMNTKEPRDFFAGGWKIWACGFFLIGTVLCFVPLFNLVGYESSFILAILGSFAGIWQGTKTIAKHRAHGTQINQNPIKAIFSCFGEALLLTESLLLFPFFLLLLNGFRVQNCNYFSGLHFFFLMPIISVACAVAFGIAAGACTSTKARGYLLGYFILGMYLGWSLLRFLASPAIYLYDPFFGYFPGAIYDENIEIQSAFYYARLLHFLGILCILLGAALWIDISCRCFRGDWTKFRIQLLLGWILTACALVTLFLSGGKLGIYTDIPSLESYLDHAQETTHFVVRYRDGQMSSQDVALLVKEAEIRYEQLHELLGTEPTWRSSLISRALGLDSHASKSPTGIPKIVIYMFGSAQEKQRWIGASDTYIAKPWRREIYLHLHRESWPNPVLKHELAHIFAGTFGDDFLRLSLRYGIPHPGMIEGAAVAFDWPGGTLSIHQKVKAMRELKLEPSLLEVLGLSFWALPPERAYTVSGSFCRYLLERFGPIPLSRMYLLGGNPDEFIKIYGIAFGTLAQDWSQFIDAQPLETKKREGERDSLRRPAIFHKVCAHEIAQWQKKAQEALQEGRLLEAYTWIHRICGKDPEEPAHQVERMEILWALQDREGVQQAATELLAHKERTPTIEAAALARLGDLAVLRDELQTAQRYYEQAASLPLPENEARLLTAKLLVIEEPKIGRLLLDVLIGAKVTLGSFTVDRTEVLDVILLEQACNRVPNNGFFHYLLGRRLSQNRAYMQAALALEQSLVLGLPDERFTWQAILTLGQAQLLVDQPRLAQATFEKLLPLVKPSELGRKLLVEDWVDRARRWNAILR